ncbi:hypothetical protein UFOVP95_36 [uncultured Caudovirales phage]|uniref:Uncharacterized protein n=1 Tax=uncultured Caudovirales phage TaxID=2100421 RepID=A0A6J5L4U7_9CAUD|nr:hypothetical protein UFOVP95_36 [uncultured Caudovirales phage]
MADYKNKDGSGVLFFNEDKRNEKAPDYKGKLILDRDYTKGSEVKISGWRKKTPKNHLVSLAVDNYSANADKQWPKPVHDDESIPF